MRCFPGDMCYLHCATPASATNLPYCSRDLDIPMENSAFPYRNDQTWRQHRPHREKTHIPKTALVGRARLPQPSQSMQPPDSRIPAAPLGTAAALMSSSVTYGAGWVEARKVTLFTPT